jgi:hypothetical protein
MIKFIKTNYPCYFEVYTMYKFTVFLCMFIVAGCSSPKVYTWQDTRNPARNDASNDTKVCQDYAARQYQPGMPTGEPYLEEQKTPSDLTAEYKTGEWRPDRDPGRATNIRSRPIHDVPTEYTGYPGELDYYPDYLDDIFAKCMNDKGWEYEPEPEEKAEAGNGHSKQTGTSLAEVNTLKI